MNSLDSVVIVGAARTPIGDFQGALRSLSAPQLGAVAMRAAVERSGLRPETVEEVLMGCVLPAGLGQAPARQAALQAGISESAKCTTVSKVCGSGMKAVTLAHDMLFAGSAGIVVAGGMESMSNAPYLLPKSRDGYRLGHSQVLDHMFLDGLEDAYSVENRGRLMGTFAEDCASKYGFTRGEQDDFATQSTMRARTASEQGYFAWEIAPVTLTRRGESIVFDRDEGPLSVDFEKIPRLKPAFRSGGTVTAANSSSISDGAAALAMTRASNAAKLGLAPVARIAGHASYACAPALFPIAPIHAIQKLLDQIGWGVQDVHLFEINEAFGVVTLAAIHDLQISPEAVNVHGGACALGHPIGASGARIIVTLLGALRQHGVRRGVASLCIGGGEAIAIAVELV